MSEQIGRISANKRKRLLAENNGICAICGLPITESYSLEHIFPQSIYKWLYEDINEEEREHLKKCLMDERNLFVTHVDCNNYKSDELIDYDGIENLHISEDAKKEVRELFNEILNYYWGYLALRSDLLDKTKYKCKICGRDITLFKSTIRRIDNRKARTIKNAIIVCSDCNEFKKIRSWRRRNGKA